jgi:hypothetical protein
LGVGGSGMCWVKGAAGVVDEADERTARAIGLTSGSGAHRVAGVREVWEETGLALFGSVLTSGAVDGGLGARREALGKDASQLLEASASCGLSLGAVAEGVSALRAWARFRAPVFEVRQFDAVTFLSVARGGDGALVDAEYLAEGMARAGAPCFGVGAGSLTRGLRSGSLGEALALGWLEPREAVGMHERGEILLPPPQFAMLSELSELLPTIEALEDFAASLAKKVDPATDLPASAQPVLTLRDGDDVPVGLLPGDAAYPVDGLRGAPADRNRIVFAPKHDPPSERWAAFAAAARAEAEDKESDGALVAGVRCIREHGARLGRTRKEGVPVADTAYQWQVGGAFAIPGQWRVV